MCSYRKNVCAELWRDIMRTLYSHVNIYDDHSSGDDEDALCIT